MEDLLSILRIADVFGKSEWFYIGADLLYQTSALSVSIVICLEGLLIVPVQNIQAILSDDCFK